MSSNPFPALESHPTKPQCHFRHIALSGIGAGVAYPGICAFPQTLAGPESAGRWMGLQNGFANLAGVVSPALAGILLDRTGSLASAFVITSAVMLAGGFAWFFWVGRLERVFSVPPLTEAAPNLV